MILEALVKRYEAQVTAGKIPLSGWSMAKVSFALRINDAGQLLDVIDLREEKKLGKKSALVSILLEVPEQFKRAGETIKSNFLCENASYLLGTDNKGKPERSVKCFEAAKKLHQEILALNESPSAVAVKNFFANWAPTEADNHPALQKYLKEIKSASNLIFTLDGLHSVSEDTSMKAAWENYRQSQEDAENSLAMQCLVTGKTSPVARLHPSIKGVRNAQSSGASLVSFNSPAFESYDRREGQGLNAPVSKYAAFAYATALNDLLADFKHVKFFGDSTVVYWAEESDDAYPDCFDMISWRDSADISDEILDSYIQNIASAKPFDFENVPLNFSTPFYILGLSPNSARLSVRFFLRQTFGDVMQNLARHYQDCKLVKPSFKPRYLPMWKLLEATVSSKSRDKISSPLMTGAVLSSILTGVDYPFSLFQNVMLRIKAESDSKITYERAVIIKAYLARNRKKANLVALNDDISDAAYILGRIFAVLENIQESANPGLNATIKDRYFNAACSTPARIFPLLHKLSVHHLRKLGASSKIFFDRQLTHLTGKLSAEAKMPALVSLEEQGMFILGYYHQTQERYKKKEEKLDGERD